MFLPTIGSIVADPGHFHAPLVQKEMYLDLSPKVHVYARLGPDLAAKLGASGVHALSDGRDAGIAAGAVEIRPRGQGVSFPVELKTGVNGAPD